MTAQPETSAIQALIDRVQRFFDQELWDIEIAGLPTFRAIGVRVTRVLSLAWQGMVAIDPQFLLAYGSQYDCLPAGM